MDGFVKPGKFPQIPQLISDNMPSWWFKPFSNCIILSNSVFQVPNTKMFTVNIYIKFYLETLLQAYTLVMWKILTTSVLKTSEPGMERWLSG